MSNPRIDLLRRHRAMAWEAAMGLRAQGRLEDVVCVLDLGDHLAKQIAQSSGYPLADLEDWYHRATAGGQIPAAVIAIPPKDLVREFGHAFGPGVIRTLTSLRPGGPVVALVVSDGSAMLAACPPPGVAN